MLGMIRILVVLAAVSVAQIRCFSFSEENESSSTTLETDGLIDLEEFKKTYYTSPVKTSSKKKFDITQLRKQKVLPGGRYMLTSQELRSESIVEGVQIVAVDFGEVTLEFWSFQDCGVLKTCTEHLTFERDGRFSIYDFMPSTRKLVLRLEPGLNTVYFERPARLPAGTMLVFTQEARLVLVDTTGGDHSDYLISFTRKTSDDLSLHAISKFRNSNLRFFIDLIVKPMDSEDEAMVHIESVIGNTSPLSGLPVTEHHFMSSHDAPGHILTSEKYILSSFNFYKPSYLKEIEFMAAAKGPIRLQFLQISWHYVDSAENVTVYSDWTQHLDRSRKLSNNEIETVQSLAECNIYIDKVGHNVIRFQTPVLIDANSLVLLEHYSTGRVAIDVSSRAAKFPSDYLYIDLTNAIRLDSKHNQQFYINFKIAHLGKRASTQERMTSQPRSHQRQLKSASPPAFQSSSSSTTPVFFFVVLLILAKTLY